MIVSRTHGFVFMHNPKVAGSSVRAVLDKWRDPDVDLFATDPNPTAPLHRVDRAHIGIAEFAANYPDLWAQTRDFPFYVLYRDPFSRFLSSVNEYCRVYGETDIRFAAQAERRNVFFGLIDRLRALGTAEGVMDILELTHFRPQWIYLTPPEGADIRLRAFGLKEIPRFATELSGCIGETVDFGRENGSEQFDLPLPMRRILANNSVKKQLRKLPGAMWAMQQLRQRSAGTPQSGARLSVQERYGLTEAEHQEVETFVQGFYARDLGVISGLAQAAHPVEA
ncbi:hypothetical protein CKO11_11165 [Rhodobacter sp. TJ_12]|uniref:hypothetical protein n=1 Tax=Rhodobacter sp. TJ_12 TaxID=2029399 RepID=UPI001CBD24E8|nr:hypothetical protein [Rhodobacter sp. TJ_12]MBZ4023019.1 hypothetical protein [Rhodobacter sp. TJ_12]